MQLPILKIASIDKAYTDGLSCLAKEFLWPKDVAFSWYGLDYGLKQVSISGLSPDAEPSAARLAELTEHIEKTRFLSYFGRECLKPLPILPLSKETGVKLDAQLLGVWQKKQSKASMRTISVMEKPRVLTDNRSRRDGSWAREGRNTKTVLTVTWGCRCRRPPLSDYVGNWQSVSFPWGWNFWSSLWTTRLGWLARWPKMSTRFTRYIRQMWLRSTSLTTLWICLKVAQSKQIHHKYVGKKILTYKKYRGERFWSDRCGRWTVQVCSV